jgi:hypothetical protein
MALPVLASVGYTETTSMAADRFYSKMVGL